MTVDMRSRYLEAMSRMAASVSVLTTDGPGGLAGVTVSSMTSLSADGRAPSLLACVNSQSASAAAILANGCFAANVLGHAQSELSDRFSGRGGQKGASRFDGLSLSRGETGCPLIAGAAISFDCRLANSLLWETHYLFVGEVAGITMPDVATPVLLYAARAYRRIEGMGHAD
jgi:flavin reductase (DIM6/NTAB) family NADH-FMN oxidoreductase RutF